jgi:hypothetical protein
MVVSKKELEAQVYTLATQVVDLTSKLLKARTQYKQEVTILSRKVWELQEERVLLKHLGKYGKLHFNYSSTDCDGVSSAKGLTFKSIKKYEQFCDMEAEWADGPFNLELCKPKDLIEEDATYYRE